jgi:SulP family sulfate permease
MAVAAGVLLTIVLYVFSSAHDVRVKAVIPLPQTGFSEVEPPDRLPNEAVTVLNVYGSLFFAGARTLAEVLPSPESTSRPVVVLRLRGRTRVGSTLIDVLDKYADALAEVGGRLYLSGVDEDVGRHLRLAGKLDLDRTVHLVPESNVIGASTKQAVAAASAWLGRTLHGHS